MKYDKIYQEANPHIFHNSCSEETDYARSSFFPSKNFFVSRNNSSWRDSHPLSFFNIFLGLTSTLFSKVYGSSVLFAYFSEKREHNSMMC